MVRFMEIWRVSIHGISHYKTQFEFYCQIHGYVWSNPCGLWSLLVGCAFMQGFLSFHQILYMKPVPTTISSAFWSHVVGNSVARQRNITWMDGWTWNGRSDSGTLDILFPLGGLVVVNLGFPGSMSVMGCSGTGSAFSYTSKQPALCLLCDSFILHEQL